MKNRAIGWYALTAVFMCGTVGFAAAQELQETLAFTDQQNLNPAVVTATRTPLSVKDSPELIRVISMRDIEKSGSKNIQEVLETELAGVEFHQAGYGESMTFQGLDARYLVFLVDGERIAGETYGNIDYGRLPLNNIERIEILRGASSVLYGSNAMGAVINIITKKPVEPVTLVASGRFGTNYQKNEETVRGLTSKTKTDVPNIAADLYAGFVFGRLTSQTTASYIGSDGYILFSEKPESRHYAELENLMTGAILPDVDYVAPLDTLGLGISSLRSVNLVQAFDYRIDPRWRAYAKGGYFHKNVFGFPKSQTYGTADGPYTWETFNSYNLQGGVEFSPNDDHRVTLSYNGDWYNRGMDSMQYLVPKQKHVVQTARLLWTGQLGNYNRVTSGLEYASENLHYDLSEFGYNDREDLNTLSLYMQDELKTNTPLSFTGGVRVDYSDRFDWNFTPKISAKYSVTNCSARINYSEGYRNPTLKELFMSYTIPIGSVTIVGNPDLKPEYNRYLSVSAEYLNEYTHVAVSGYTSWFRDKIDVQEVREGRAIKLIYNNIDKSRYSGVEIMAKARLFPGFFVMGDYNYVHQMESGNIASQQYIYPSPHTATLKLDYRFAVKQQEFNVHLSGRYIGEKEYSVAYANPIRMSEYPGGIFMGTYTATHEAYTLWNLSATAYLSDKLTLQCGVDNLFDYQAPVINFNACMSPGRNGFAKLIFRFD